MEQTSSNQRKAAACVIGAGALWGCISIFIRNLTAGGLATLQISMVRSIMGAIFMIVFLLMKDKNLLKIKLRDCWYFLGTGVMSFTLFNVCYFSAIQQSQASVAVVLLYTSPIFVMLMSAVFFREKITNRKVAALLLAFGGCVLVAGIFGGSYRLPLQVILVGIGAGFFYATYSIFGRVALQKYDTMTVTAYTFIFAALGLIPVGNLPQTVKQLSLKPSLILWCIALTLLCTVVPYLLYTAGLKGLETGKAAILATIEPLVGALIGMLLFREPHNVAKLLGIGCIFAAVLICQGKNQGEKEG